MRLRLLGSCQGCPSSSVTLKFAVEDAIESAAPEVTAIEVVEEETLPAVPALIPVDALLVRLDAPPTARQTAGPGDAGGLARSTPAAAWQPVPEIAGLEPGDVAGFLVGGYPVLACRIGPDVYAYRDYCPRCMPSMAGATLQRALAAPAGGGLLRCPSCRGHFDVRQAGSCLEDRNLHLDPLPLLVRAGVMSVAVPVASEQDGLRWTGNAAPTPAGPAAPAALPVGLAAPDRRQPARGRPPASAARCAGNPFRRSTSTWWIWRATP